MPIGKITSLLKQGMWQLLGEVGVVNKPDIQEIKNLEILSSRRLLSSRCSHSTRTLDKLSQIGVNFTLTMSSRSSGRWSKNGLIALKKSAYSLALALNSGDA